MILCYYFHNYYYAKFSDDDPDLVLLVNIVDLLSVCAEDKCQSAKHFCQNVFSVEELLR